MECINKTKPNVFPVIHYLDDVTSLDQADMVAECDAQGLFLISHHGQDAEIAALATTIKQRHPQLKVGLNFLNLGVLEAARACELCGLDMVWGDNCGVSSEGFNAVAQKLSRIAVHKNGLRVFASVAFKYQAHEPDPAKAALKAQSLGFIPTTSGSGTGSAPTVDKIKAMSEATNGQLAIASGMDPENIHLFAPYLSDILVATGVSVDEYRFDYEKLRRFVALARM